MSKIHFASVVVVNMLIVPLRKRLSFSAYELYVEAENEYGILEVIELLV